MAHSAGEAPTMEMMLLPSPKTGAKWDNAEKMATA